MAEQITGIFSFLTLVSNIALLIVVVLYITRGLSKAQTALWAKLENLFTRKALALIFVFSLTAVVGSLLFSEVAKFTPCKFCWLQRIFMYPLPLISGIALVRKHTEALYYIVPMAVIGVLLAGYHYAMQMSVTPFAPCSTLGYSVSCSEKFFASYGFITIPWMSLSAFTYILLISVLTLQKGKK